MTNPLALVLYERLLPGSQIVNKLQDLKYRVQTSSDFSQLVQTAEEAKPMIVLADLESNRGDVHQSISALKSNPSTSHVPVIAFGTDTSAEAQARAQAAGVTLLVSETAVLTHLPQFLEQALQFE